MSDEMEDLDRLFAAAARHVRPDPTFEEALLLRLDDELAQPADEIGVDPVKLRPAITERRRPRRVALARAAAFLLLAGAAIGAFVAVSDEAPTVETGLPATSATALADACEAHLPAVALYAIDANLSGAATELDWQETVIDDLRSAIDGLREAIGESRSSLAPDAVDPRIVQTLDTAAADIEDLDVFMTDEETVWGAGFRNQARTSMPRVANELNAIATELSALGVPACVPEP